MCVKNLRKFRLFIENFFIYGLGSAISKVVPFIMLPVVTRLIPDTKYYGVSDLSTTIVTLASAVGVMGMYDAMYRMFFEREEQAYKVRVCSTAFFFCLCNSFVVFVLLLLFRNWLAELFFKNTEYAYLIYITAVATLVGSTNAIVSAPTRMQNKRMVFVVMNTVTPVVGYAVSIPLLLNGYYVIALPLAAMVSAILTELVFGVLNYRWFRPSQVDFKLMKELLILAVPIFPVFICYWALDSCNRVILSNLVGSAQVGIYAVGTKLGAVSQLIYAAFAGGWQYFAFSTMKDKNQVKDNTLVFEYLGAISFVATMFVCAFSYEIYSLLFVGDYVKGFLVAPYLFLSPLLLMLYQVSGSQFLVARLAWPRLLVVPLGAVVNIVLNLQLIPILGIEGSAVGSVVGYATTVVITSVVLCKLRLMEFSWRFAKVVVLFTGYFLTWRFMFVDKIVPAFLLACVVTGAILWLYKQELLWVKGKLVAQREQTTLECKM